MLQLGTTLDQTSAIIANNFDSVYSRTYLVSEKVFGRNEMTAFDVLA